MRRLSTSLLGAVAAGVLAAGSFTAHAADKTMTIATWGGAYQESQQKAYFAPFEAKDGVKILTDEWSGETAKLKGMVEAHHVTWDVVDVEPTHALQGCEEGWLEKIDYSKLGGKDKFLPGSALECGVGNVAFAYVMAYDVKKFPNGGPQTAADFWDVKKFPGARSLRKAPKSTLELALVADGVAPKDVYKALGTADGVNRAFKKLDAIKPYVKVWWAAGAQPPQLLSDGEVAMTTSYNGRIYDAVVKDHKDFKILWDAALLEFDMWAIPKGSPHKDLAESFIAFAAQAGPNAAQTKYIPYGPARLDAIAMVDASVVPSLPTSPQNSATSFTVDDQFWADHDEELTQRFNEWLSK